VLLAEAEEENRREEVQRLRGEKWRCRYLNSVTLEQLRKKSDRFFSDWDPDYVGANNLSAIRRLFADTVEALIALGPKASRRRKLYRLKRCILQLNKLNEREQFIDTVERERLIWQFEEIACAAGWQAEDNLADRWRDW
jgi:hypothetical protein